MIYIYIYNINNKNDLLRSNSTNTCGCKTTFEKHVFVGLIDH